jgi:hypothetical protein
LFSTFLTRMYILEGRDIVCLDITASLVAKTVFLFHGQELNNGHVEKMMLFCI